MWAVRRYDARAVQDVIGCEDPVALAVVLAALVPAGVDTDAALAWTGAPREPEVALHRLRAERLAAAVRAWDYARVRQLCEADLSGTCVVLAALADPEAPEQEALEWVEQAYERHVRAPLDPPGNRRRLEGALPYPLNL